MAVTFPSLSHPATSVVIHGVGGSGGCEQSADLIGLNFLVRLVVLRMGPRTSCRLRRCTPNLDFPLFSVGNRLVGERGEGCRGAVAKVQS